MSPTSQAHRVLRAATAPHHAEAEDAFAGFDLGSREGYRAFLLAQASAVLPLERWIGEAGIADALPDWPSRRRGHLLVNDLESLGAGAPACADARLPGDALGAVYVLEGSRFGGRLLARRVGTGAEATRYLRHEGTPGGWSRLWAAIDGEIAAGHRRLDAMVVAAAAAFSLFRHGAVHGMRHIAAGAGGGARRSSRSSG